MLTSGHEFVGEFPADHDLALFLGLALSVQSLRAEELKRTDHDQNTLLLQRYYLARRPDGPSRCLREVFSVGVASRRLAFLLAASQPGGNPASPVSFRFFRSTKSRKVRALKRKDARAGRMRAIDFCRCPPAVEPCRGGRTLFPGRQPSRRKALSLEAA